MNQKNGQTGRFVEYEYKEVIVAKKQTSFYIDGYENFGWIAEDKSAHCDRANQVVLRMKRDRKIGNKAELTRLQQHFEACTNDIRKMEAAKKNAAVIGALSTAIFGTVFMAGAAFAVVHEPPIIWLCILLAVPGFIGWIVPWFLYRFIIAEKKKKYQPLINEKYEEIYKICEKGHSFL